MATMVEISASMVKELRERSGAAMMDCKKALVEAEGSFDKAFELLRQRGIAVAGKKASRTTSEGLVVGKTSPDGKLGVIVEVNCETDFVARNPEFVELAEQIREAAASAKPKDVESLLQSKIGSATVQDTLTEKVAKTGENIVVRRVSVYERNNAHGTMGLYIHALGGKMGALLELSSSKDAPADELTAVARDVAMHVVSAKPQFVHRGEVPADVVENEKRIESGKADLADKKAEIKEKIIAGRVDKLMAERCLMDQPFVKDPSKTIAQFLKEKGAAWGAELQPVRFALFILGDTQTESGGNGAA